MATDERENGVSGSCDSSFPAVVDLNVGGVFYSTSLSTLISDPKSKLCQLFSSSEEKDEAGIIRDSKVRLWPYFETIKRHKQGRLFVLIK